MTEPTEATFEIEQTIIDLVLVVAGDVSPLRTRCTGTIARIGEAA
jgi:hypothetical protein